MGISLRERKHAKTKLAIMEEFVKRLEMMHFEDISIGEVCAAAEISEGTFFNYFPKKLDVVYYFKSYMYLYDVWHIEKQLQGKKTLQRIDMLFDSIAERIPSSNFLSELMLVFIREGSTDIVLELTETEKKIAFPDCEGIEDIELLPMEEYLEKVISEAVHNGELHKDIVPQELAISVLSVLCGTMLALPKELFHERRKYFQKHLSYIWRSVGRNII